MDQHATLCSSTHVREAQTGLVKYPALRWSAICTNSPPTRESAMRRITPLFAILLLAAPCQCVHKDTDSPMAKSNSIQVFPGPGWPRLRNPGLFEPSTQCMSQGDVYILNALPDPVDLPDARGEVLTLRNDSCVPIALDGWSLKSGRRQRFLDNLVVSSGGIIRLGHASGDIPLGGLRLRNRMGCVTLVDPCGMPVSALGWLSAKPGWHIVSPRHASPGPYRWIPGSRRGGCGQT